VEKEWLEKADGPFKEFFEKFLKQTKPLCTPEEFLKLLDGNPTLLTHSVWADEEQLKLIADANHTIIHCPRSNRLLGCGRLKIEKLNKTNIPWLLGTDGLSSNRSLNLWDEMRSALMMHCELDLESLALELLKAVTSKAAKALNLPIGKIKEGNWADIIIITLPDMPESSEQLPLQLILHTNNVKQLYIQGQKYA
jgi:cytosine/adenosine deaminase-related metal-dependent hydrolase